MKQHVEWNDLNICKKFSTFNYISTKCLVECTVLTNGKIKWDEIFAWKWKTRITFSLIAIFVWNEITKNLRWHVCERCDALTTAIIELLHSPISVLWIALVRVALVWHFFLNSRIKLNCHKWRACVTEQKNISKMGHSISITVIRKGYGNVSVAIEMINWFRVHSMRIHFKMSK